MRPGPPWGISPTAPTATRRFRASTARTTSIGTARSWRRSARRSRLCNRAPAEERGRNARRRLSAGLRRAHAPRREGGGAGAGRLGGAASRRLRGRRSEEHTSELQSPYDLVCRLLLEKKKQKTK